MKKFKNNKKVQGGVFIASFTLIGVLLLLPSRAAIPTAHFEPESGNVSSAASKVADASASGGEALEFGPGDVSPPEDYEGPLTINSGGTYSGAWESTSTSTPVLRINTSQPVIIEDSYMRGPGDIIVSGVDHVKLTVRNTTTFGTGQGGCNGRQVAMEQFDKLEFTNNYFEKTGGIYLLDYAGSRSGDHTVKILRNKVRNIMSPGGCLVQFAQMDKVTGVPGMEIAWNEIINEPGESRVEDNINIYLSGGTGSSPLRIHNNFIRGAFDIDPEADYTGGGIMMGDGQNNSQTGPTHAYDNQVVGIGNYGIAIAAGHDMIARDNRVVSSGVFPDGSGREYFTNIGMYNWNLYEGSGFSNNQMYDNVVGYQNGSTRNDWWLPDCSGSCSNQSLKSGKITLADEEAEFTRWKNKVQSSDIDIGPQ